MISIRKWIGFLSSLVLVLFLSGCMQTPQIPKLANAKVGKIVDIKEPPTVEELKQQIERAPKIKFKELVRDPFVPPAVLRKKGLSEIRTTEELEETLSTEKGASERKPSKKEQALIEAVQHRTFTITGIMQDATGEYYAIFGLPDGKTYIITEGLTFGNYRVVRITPKKIIIMKGDTKLEIPVPNVR